MISTAAATMLLSAVTAQTGTLELEILSKDDAGAIFAMTRAERTESVRRAVMGGAARATGSPESGIALVTNTRAGELFVRDTTDNSLRLPCAAMTPKRSLASFLEVPVPVAAGQISNLCSAA